MWTSQNIRELRLKLGMSYFQFATKLGVSVPTVEMWEHGVTVPPFHQAKLNNLKEEASSYLTEKARLADEIRQHEADKQKSDYIIERLPDGGSVAAKRR